MHVMSVLPDHPHHLLRSENVHVSDSQRETERDRASENLVVWLIIKHFGPPYVNTDLAPEKHTQTLTCTADERGRVSDN